MRSRVRTVYCIIEYINLCVAHYTNSNGGQSHIVGN